MNKKQINYFNISMMLIIAISLLTIITSILKKDISLKEVKINNIQAPFTQSKITKYNGDVPKVVFLTFDDGPDTNVIKELDILKSNNIKATFFLIGPNIKKFPEITRRIISDGHYVGSHSMSHDYNLLYRKNNPTWESENKEVFSILKNDFNYDTKLIRAPFGTAPYFKQNKVLPEQTIKNQWIVWDWTIDSNDWRSPDPNKAYENVKKELEADIRNNRNMSVVLMHERESSLGALQKVIDLFKSKNYTFLKYDPKLNIHSNFGFSKEY